jgi:hypothetical protein
MNTHYPSEMVVGTQTWLKKLPTLGVDGLFAIFQKIIVIYKYSIV